MNPYAFDLLDIENFGRVVRERLQDNVTALAESLLVGGPGIDRHTYNRLVAIAKIAGLDTDLWGTVVDQHGRVVVGADLDSTLAAPRYPA